jgi:GNAT superfamily N-acetyltransferase
MPTITIEPLTTAQIGHADRIFRQAFGRDRSSADFIGMLLTLRSRGYFLARQGDRPAGIGGAFDYGSFAYLGMMAVLPELQGQGIGAALVKHIIAWARRREIATILLDATEKGARLYSRCGFSPCGQATLFKTPVPFTPQESRLPVTALGEAHLDALVAYDENIFGARRRDMVTHLMHKHPGRVLGCLGSQGQLTGYLIAQPYSLGPWMADNLETAQSLLYAAQRLGFDDAPTICLPLENAAGQQLVSALGCTPILTNQHMQWGQGGLNRQREKIYGQISFALG